MHLYCKLIFNGNQFMVNKSFTLWGISYNNGILAGKMKFTRYLRDNHEFFREGYYYAQPHI